MPVDPTENVKALSEASNKRQDDLRAARDRLTDTKLAHIEQIVSLQACHAKELRQAESNRIDAIRQRDERAREADAQRSQDAIKILEVTTATINSGINERISKLELAYSKGEGRSTGLNFGWEKLIALVGLLGGLIALFAFFAK